MSNKQEEKVRTIVSQGLVYIASLAFKDAVNELLNLLVPEISSQILYLVTLSATLFLFVFLIA